MAEASRVPQPRERSSGRPASERRESRYGRGSRRPVSLRLPYAAREKLNIDLDADVASLLRSHAAEAHVSEGVRIAARAIRTLDLRSLVARIRERRDFDDEQAMALAGGELQAVTSPKLPANVGAVLGRPRLRRYLSTYEATRYVDDLAALTVQLGDPAERHAAVFRDPREDYLVALAQSSNAEAVFTGDLDLLAIDPSELEIEILIRVFSSSVRRPADAEGRGFGSLHPLREKPGPSRLLLLGPPRARHDAPLSTTDRLPARDISMVRATLGQFFRAPRFADRHV